MRLRRPWPTVTVAKLIGLLGRDENARRCALATSGMIAALLVSGVLASASLAAEPLPITSTSPADGATIPIPDGLIVFQFTTPLDLDDAHIVVGTQLEQDGTLARSDEVDYFTVDVSDSDPRTYREVASYSWTQHPGTYYWQIEARRPGEPEESELGSEPRPPKIDRYLSPVYSLVIAGRSAVPPPQPPSAPGFTPPILTLSESYSAVERIVKERSGDHADRLHDKCHRESQNTATCEASWALSYRASAPTWQYVGDFQLEARTVLRFSFTGRRARYGCVRRLGVKHCATKVHWRS
jgi:hypothetical protein